MSYAPSAQFRSLKYGRRPEFWPAHAKSFHSNRKILDRYLVAIQTVGEVTGHAAEAHALVGTLRERIERITSMMSGIRNRPRVFCMEWMV